MLHGNGNAPDMMATLARTLDLGRVIVICPEAPYVKLAETIEARAEKYTAMQVAPGTPDTLLPRVIDLSAEWYKGVIDDARRTLPVDTTRGTMLIGFSQGGFFAHVLLTRHPQAFSHVVSICASMYAAGGVVERYPAVVPFAVKILVAHGTKDDVVPFQTGELIHGQLDRAGIQHVWLPFDGGHATTPPVLDAIRTLLR
jgi:phospholipase/carboxylesterase